MDADLIQANYDTLDDLATRFGQQAEAIQELHQLVQRASNRLEQGGWQGEGARAFLSELHSVTFPTMCRLQEALTQGRQTMGQIKAILQAAEEEAARPFQGGTAVGIIGNSGTAVPGDTPNSPDTPSTTETGTKFKSSRELIVKDPKDIFNEAYMEKFIGSHFAGENNSELNQLMEALLHKAPASETEVGPMLDRIADIRGVDRATFRQQYQTFLNLWPNASN